MWLVAGYAVILFASLIQARRTEGDVDGFRIPGGWITLGVTALVPVATRVLLLVFTAAEHVVLGCSMLALGPVLYFASRAVARSRTRR